MTSQNKLRLPSGGWVEAPVDLLMAIATRQIPDLIGIRKFGYNDDLDAPEDIIRAGGSYVWIVTAGTASIVSSSINDDLAGTGAQKIMLDGLDASGNIQIVEVDMDGTTPVVTTETWLRCPRAYVSQSGSGQVNAGLITVTIDSKIAIQINAGDGQSLYAVYTVPLGYKGYITSYHMPIGINVSAAYVIGMIKTNTNGQGWRTREIFSSSVANATPVKLDYPIELDELTDIIFTTDAVSDVNTKISASFDIFLVKQ